MLTLLLCILLSPVVALILFYTYIAVTTLISEIYNNDVLFLITLGIAAYCMFF